MRIMPGCFLIFLIWISSSLLKAEGENPLPPFGRDTVLVWTIHNREYESQFVVRLAAFAPDRFLEWEDERTQGTVFMASADLLDANSFIGGSKLFQSGVDAKSKNATILWPSRKIFRNLKEKGKIKCDLDGVPTLLILKGNDRLPVEINKSVKELPVIKVADDRDSERWFVDSEDNPLQVKHIAGKYVQTLTSITTNKPNTLRWIKGDKLKNPSR
jgi:hypothetical protein